MSTWSSGIGKFIKKDPNHGAWGRKTKHTMKKIWNRIKHWCCKVGLCNFDKCSCDCHDKPQGRSKAYYPTHKAKSVLPPLPEQKLKADGTPDKRFKGGKKDQCSMF